MELSKLEFSHMVNISNISNISNLSIIIIMSITSLVINVIITSDPLLIRIDSHLFLSILCSKTTMIHKEHDHHRQTAYEFIWKIASPYRFPTDLDMAKTMVATRSSQKAKQNNELRTKT